MNDSRLDLVDHASGMAVHHLLNDIPSDHQVLFLEYDHLDRRGFLVLGFEFIESTRFGLLYNMGQHLALEHTHPRPKNLIVV